MQVWTKGGTEARVAETGDCEWIGKWAIRLNGPICPCSEYGCGCGCGCRDNARPRHDPRTKGPKRAAARRAAAGGTFRAIHVIRRKQASAPCSIILFFLARAVSRLLCSTCCCFSFGGQEPSRLYFPGPGAAFALLQLQRQPITNCAALCVCACILTSRTRALLALDSPRRRRRRAPPTVLPCTLSLSSTAKPSRPSHTRRGVSTARNPARYLPLKRALASPVSPKTSPVPSPIRSHS